MDKNEFIVVINRYYETSAAHGYTINLVSSPVSEGESIQYNFEKNYDWKILDDQSTYNIVCLNYLKNNCKPSSY